VAYLADQVNRVLALGKGHPIDPHRSILDLGMDSLMAMELRNRIQAAMKVQVAIADLLGGASVDDLAVGLLGTLSVALSKAAAGTGDRSVASGAEEPLEPAVAGQGLEEWEEGSL
jgi:acyl carrier protein